MINILKEKNDLSVKSASLLLAGLTIARGSSFLMSKNLLETISPLCLLFHRFSIAFIFLFIIFLPQTLRSIRQKPSILLTALLLGSVYFLCMASELVGLQYTTAATCSFLENSAIVIVPVIEAVIVRCLPKPIIIISSFLTFTGIALIVFHDTSIATPKQNHPLFGILLCAIAALMYAFAIIITDRFSKKYDPLILGILYVGIMSIWGGAASFMFETPTVPTGMIAWTQILVLAILCTGFGFAMQPIAQKPLTSEITGIICALNPLSTAVLGWILMMETPGLQSIIGACLIIAGILLPNIITKKKVLKCKGNTE